MDTTTYIFVKKKNNNMWITLLIWSYEPMMNWTHLCLASNKRDTGKQCRPRSDAAECYIWSGFILFVFNSGISTTDTGNTKTQPETPYIRKGSPKRVVVGKATQHKWVNILGPKSRSSRIFLRKSMKLIQPERFQTHSKYRLSSNLHRKSRDKVGLKILKKKDKSRNFNHEK